MSWDQELRLGQISSLSLSPFPSYFSLAPGRMISRRDYDPRELYKWEKKECIKSVSTYLQIAQEAGEFRLSVLTSVYTHNSLASFNFGFPCFNFLFLHECSVAQVNLTVPSAGETERCTAWPCPQRAHRTIRMGKDRGCGYWVPSDFYKLEMGPGLKRE